MSLGLPGHLAAHSESRAFARSAHVVALVCLLATVGILLSVHLTVPQLDVVLMMLSLSPMILALFLLERVPSAVVSGLYVVVGVTSIYLFVRLAVLEFPPGFATNDYLFTLPKIALIMVAGPGPGVVSRMVWAVVGGVFAEGATILAATHSGISPSTDGTALAVLAAVVAVLFSIGFSQSRVRLAQPGLHRAARDEHLSGMRERFEEQAAAMVHDTILNHLAAVASAQDGPLSREAAARIESDIAELVGGEWLLAPDPDAPLAGLEWRSGKFLRALDEARELGLIVQFSGDPSAAARLDPLRETALGLAVKQCLVNVVTHAGTDFAEVVIYGSGDEVTVMIIDDGRGFAERETSVDRLGLRQSVRRRIEAVGGSVQVWSTPGTGTSVLIRLPTTESAQAATAP